MFTTIPLRKVVVTCASAVKVVGVHSREPRYPAILLLLLSLVGPWKGLRAQCSGYGSYQSPYIAGYHSAMVTTINGIYVWGDAMTPAGTSTNVLTPVALTPANGYAYTGSPLLFTLGEPESGDPQSFLLTTTGLYVWGYEDAVLANATTTSSAFQTTTLPTGVIPAMVRSMTANSGVLAIVSTTGNVYVRGSGSSALLGDGSTSNNNAWHQAAISNVVQLKAVNGGFFAITSAGTWYTWGPRTYLGNSTGVASRSTPVAMTAAFAGIPAMIALTNNASGISYYALNPSDRKVYVLGENVNGRLGIGNTTDRSAWTAVRNATNTGDLAPVRYITATENSADHNGVAAIMADSSLYFWGENDDAQLSTALAASQLLPKVPGGFTTGTDKATFVVMSGHYSIVQKVYGDRPCFVGHQYEGNVGNGSSSEAYINSLNCSALPNIEFCISQWAPVANNDVGSTLVEDGANGTFNVVTNDRDPNGNPSAPTNTTGKHVLDIDPATPGIQTTVTNALGVWSYAVATGIVTFNPSQDYNGTAVHSYQLCDVAGLCDDATITFLVTAVNDGPFAADDQEITARNTAITSGMLRLNDSDVDNVNEEMAWSLLSGGSAATNGTLNVHTNGSFTYTPNAGFIGTVNFTYRVCDPGSLCDNALVTIEVYSPLPVELITFEGEALSKVNRLFWTTATEQNNHRFEVERSPDGSDFTMVGSVGGAGCSQQRIDYDLYDAEAPIGVCYYRLRQVDLDGSSVMSHVIALERSNEQVRMQLLTMDPEGHYLLGGPWPEETKAEVFTLTGQRASADVSVLNGHCSVNLRALPTAVYIARVEADGVAHVSKLLRP